MTDTAPTDAPANEPPAEEQPPDTGDTTAELEKWKAQARKHEERAKANAQAAKELETLRLQSMSDIEKAAATAKAEGRAEAMREAASKVAAASLRAAATGRFEVTSDFLEGVNLAAFIDDDGEVDEAKVARFVDGIAPKPTEPDEPRFPDLGQGARGSVPLGGDQLEQLLKRTVGTR